MRRAILPLATAYALAICVVVLVASCVSTPAPPPSPVIVEGASAPFTVTNGHVVSDNPAYFVIRTNVLPVPAGAVPQVVMMTNRVAPLVTGKTNHARTNITLTLTSAIAQTLSFSNGPTPAQVVDTGYWIQASTNLTNEGSWSNLLFIPATGSNETVNVGINLKLNRYFRQTPDVWVQTNN